MQDGSVRVYLYIIADIYGFISEYWEDMETCGPFLYTVYVYTVHCDGCENVLHILNVFINSEWFSHAS